MNNRIKLPRRARPTTRERIVIATKVIAFVAILAFFCVAVALWMDHSQVATGWRRGAP